MSDEAVSAAAAAGEVGQKPKLFNRTFTIAIIVAALVVGGVYLLRKEYAYVRMNPFEASAQFERNALMEAADETRRLTAEGMTLRQALVEVGGKIVSRPQFAEYSFYLTPEVAVHGEESDMPRDEALELFGEIAPVPWVDENAGTFSVLLAHRTRGLSRAEVWSVDAQRSLTRGIYKF